MMFLPSDDRGENLETMSNMIQKKNTRVNLWLDLKIHYFQKLPEF